MSKQKQGMFRRVLNVARKAMGMSTIKHFDDPVLGARRRKKKRAHGVGSGRFGVERIKRNAAPPCDPGTITYHDKLVRHFGCRKADGFGECIQRKMMSALPSKEDFDAAVPWAWRK